MKTVQRSIVFTKPQLKWVEERAKEFGISVSEVIRRILDERRQGV